MDAGVDPKGSTVNRGLCQNYLVPVLDTGPQKNRPCQSDIYTVCSYAIPCQARERDSFDTAPSGYIPDGMSLKGANNRL